MVVVSDITMVICIRLHENNPWVLERLNLISKYYDPLPNVLIVDFGSAPDYQEQIRAACVENDLNYFYVQDFGVYSAAISHNRGFEQVKSELVFFSDIDFFFKRSIFQDLSEAADALDMKDNIDVFMDFPAYHLTETATNTFFQLDNSNSKSKFLHKIGYIGPLEKQGQSTEFIAPYSNVYLMNIKLYSLVGGYHEGFRGHGSEDFEFFIRLAYHTKIHSLPQSLEEDKYGPTKRDFFWIKQYRGFRRLNEALAMPSELMGFKAFHLWHPTGQQNDWREKNDWRRERMRGILNIYSKEPRRLLDIDYLNRPKVAICICKSPEHYGYFMPLRLAGFTLKPIYDSSPETLDRIRQDMLEEEVHAFAIFNPYMKSHKSYYPLFLMAQQLGIETIVIERGALPNTIYYASDVSYTAPEFSQTAFDKYIPNAEEISAAGKYIFKLKSGIELLEKGESYDETASKYSSLPYLNKPICLIPLQLDDDMAVTRYVRNAQTYDQFFDSLDTVIRNNPDILFIVKAHPLSNKKLLLNAENSIILDRDDNIHCLIELCDFVICYNSGVGLLSLIHGKPTITIGNAYYNMPGTGHFAPCFEAAVNSLKETEKPNYQVVQKLISFYLFSLYSQFTAQDDIREFIDRKAHAYKDILVTKLAFQGHTYTMNRLVATASQTHKSYLFSKLNVSIDGESKKNKKESEVSPKPSPVSSKAAPASSLAARKESVKTKRRRKLKNNPYQYFLDSKYQLLRPLRFLFDENFLGRNNRKFIKKVVK